MRFGDTLSEIVTQDIEDNTVVALFGESGIGKSSFVEDLAAKNGTRCFTLACNLLSDKADLTGARMVEQTKADGSTSYRQAFFPHEDLMEAIEYAREHPDERPVCFLDEINRTGSDVTSGLLSIPTKRRIGREDLPENLRIVVAGNDKGNVVALDEASLSRFAIYHVEPDAEVLIEILGDAMSPYVRTVLEKFPEMVFQRPVPRDFLNEEGEDQDPAAFVASAFGQSEEMSQITTPRTIENLSKWLNRHDTAQLAGYLATPVGDSDSSTMLREAVEAHVGRTLFAAEVVSEISRAVSTAPTISDSQATPSVTVSEPVGYAALKSAGTVSDLVDAVSALDDAARSAALLFALTEHTDNTQIIEQLANQIPRFERDHTHQLFSLASDQRIDVRNAEALLDSGTPLASALRPTLGSFL